MRGKHLMNSLNFDVLDVICNNLDLNSLLYTVCVSKVFNNFLVPRIVLVKCLLNPPFNVNKARLLQKHSFAAPIWFGPPIGLLLHRETKALMLTRKEITDADCIILANVYVNAGVLNRFVILNISDNQIGDAGMAALARACASGSMAELKELLLYNNRIGDAGCVAFANACVIKSMASLERFNLSWNQIGDAGCTALASACASGSMARLEALNLSVNQIGDAGCIALANACASGSTELEELELDGNPASREARQAVDAILNPK